MNKPVIAIVPLYDEERDSLWMLPGYMDGVIEAGGIPNSSIPVWESKTTEEIDY